MSGAAYRMVAAIEALAAADAARAAAEPWEAPMMSTFEDDREPTDDDIYNGYGREGGIAYAPDDQPGSLGENDPRLGFAW